MVEERVGEAYELDEQLTVIGRKRVPGEQAPDFSLDCLDSSESTIRTINLANSAGTVRLFNVVNSLDTLVCHLETRRWDALCRDLPAGAIVYTISMDLPYAQARWKSAEGVDHQTLSSHRSEDFGRDYGVLIKEWAATPACSLRDRPRRPDHLCRIRGRPDG